MSTYACDTCEKTPSIVLNVREMIPNSTWTSRAVSACADHEAEIRRTLVLGGYTVIGETPYNVILERMKGSRTEER